MTDFDLGNCYLLTYMKPEKDNHFGHFELPHIGRYREKPLGYACSVLQAHYFKKSPFGDLQL